ncbi:MAG: hypothetical protein PHI23_01235 [Candidatus Peribacteraceae bacterium]|nr:hypothetical protein [Candidatus Peribacteraceae bacterium]
MQKNRLLAGFFLLTTLALVTSAQKLAPSSFTAAVTSPDQVIDDGDPGFTLLGEGWETSLHSSGFRGDFVSPRKIFDENLAASWHFVVSPGIYQILVTYRGYSLLSDEVPYTIGDGESTILDVVVNQQVNPVGNEFEGVAWTELGTVDVEGPDLTLTLVRPDVLTEFGVIADGARILQVATRPPRPQISSSSSSSSSKPASSTPAELQPVTCAAGMIVVSGRGCIPDPFTKRPEPVCGNGTLEEGEECDGTQRCADGRECLSCTCRTPLVQKVCGNGLLEAGEQCERGKSCSEQKICNTKTCICVVPPPVCGNSILEQGEECDAGPMNSDTASNVCRATCKFPKCGDGVTDSARGEECDDGKNNSDTSPGRCRKECKLPRCGDKVLDPKEQCEHGKSCQNEGECMMETCTCKAPPPKIVCGDGRKEGTEECDDGNTQKGDGCSEACRDEVQASIASWKIVRASHVPFDTPHLVNYGGQIWNVGGAADATKTNVIEALINVESGSWIRIGHLPGKITHHAAVIFRDRLWVLGGLGLISTGQTTGTPPSSVYALAYRSVFSSTEGRNWLFNPPVADLLRGSGAFLYPIDRDLSALEYQEKLWVFGRYHSQETFLTYSSPDGATFTLTGAAPAIGKAVVFGDSIWMTNGRLFYSTRDGTEWTQQNVLPGILTEYTPFVSEGKLWVIGRAEAEEPLTLFLSTDGNVWKQIPLPTTLQQIHITGAVPSNEGVMLTVDEPEISDE